MKTDAIPWVAVRLAGVALVTWVAAAFYTLQGNPEVRHFRHTDAVKRAWALKMNREHGAKVVVYGGSSCEFSIDGERLLQRFQLPCVNLGRGAGIGSVVLTMAALEETKPGDTLIVALEPGLVTEPLDWPSLGVQFSLATGHRRWMTNPLPPAKPLSWFDTLLALRPGGAHTFTMLAKLARGQELYRYHVRDMRPSGFNQTPVRARIDGPPGHGVTIPPSSRAFLVSLAAWCQTNSVRVAYSLPWGYTPPDRVASFQKDNAKFLAQVAEIMPVLKDPKLGAFSEIERFADTVWHLDEEGAARRTDDFGRQLKNWEVWTVEELRTLATN